LNSFVFWLLLSGVISWGLTGALRRYAVNHHWLDVPNERSSHNIPTPRGGGLAIVVTFCLGLVVLYLVNSLSLRFLLGYVGAGGAVAMIGFIDDRAHVSPLWRLLCHLVAAIWCLICLGTISSFSLFGYILDWQWVGYVISALMLIWILNLYNFMDGIDGIAASESIFIACCGWLFALLAGDNNMQLIAVLLLGASTGFLIWNWPPARIFMGDSGSGFLGMVLGMYAYHSILNGEVAFWSWLIIFGVFFVDASYTLIKRILNRQSWYQAHRSHAYQHAARRWGHLRVMLAVSAVNVLWLLPLAYLANVHRGWGGGLALLALLPLVVTANALRAGEKD